MFTLGFAYGLKSFAGSPMISAATWLTAFMSGMMFIGIGKIIDLLEKILNK